VIWIGEERSVMRNGLVEGAMLAGGSELQCKSKVCTPFTGTLEVRVAVKWYV
jgi:hypothetical protein